jgi:phosphate transport system ATP-binding protein
MTVVMVTNLVQQARRVGDVTAFFNAGRLVEVAETETLFTRPADETTAAYLTGAFG